MGNQVKLALLGLGYWGKNLFRTFSAIPHADIRLGCDLDPKNLDALRKSHPNCEFTGDFQRAFNDPEIDGVVIATPPATHYELAKAALTAKKHTFVEKPITLDLNHANELVALSKSVGKTLMVGHLLKHHPATTYLKNLVDSGDLGEINCIYTQRVNLGIIRSDENPLWSLSPHDISLILYFSGEMPERVSAMGGSFLQKGIEDVIFAMMKFPSGHIASMHLSWLDPHKVRRLTIVGSKQMAVFDDMENREKLRIYDKGASIKSNPQTLMEYMAVRDGDIYIPKIDNREPLRIECENFLDCVQGKAETKSGGEEAVRILKVITMLDESLKSQGTGKI